MANLEELSGVKVSTRWIRLNVIFGRLESLLLLHLVSIVPYPDKHLSIRVQDHHILWDQVLARE